MPLGRSEDSLLSVRSHVDIHIRRHTSRYFTVQDLNSNIYILLGFCSFLSLTLSSNIR